MPTTPPRTATDDLAEVLAASLRSGVPGILHVRGASMLPTLAEGTPVRVRPVGRGEIAVGRIAVFRREGMLVIHRIVWKRRTGGGLEYLFRGDNGTAFERVGAGEVLGVAEGIITGDPDADAFAWEPIGWDAPGLFYRLLHLLFSPLLRIVGILTGRPPATPSGRARVWLKRIHRSVETILFGRPETR